jgi:hypothetical protein
MSSAKNRVLSGVLVGDELGQIKRIDLNSKNKIITINNELVIEGIHPSKSVVSICSLENQFNDNIMYLLANKCNSLSFYDCITNELKNIKVGVNNESSLIGAQPINASNIVLCYENGTIHLQNIEKDLMLRNETKKKAIKLLGLDLYSNSHFESDSLIESCGKSVKSSISSSSKSSTNYKDISSRPKPRPISHQPSPKPSQTANAISQSVPISSSNASIYSPNWNTSSTCFTCFKVCNNNIAIAGRNVDLKVFDLNTKQNTFTAKSSSRDWLGLKQHIWVSGLDWVGGNSMTNMSPSMVATCSRSDSCVRIYDMKCKQKKPVMDINLKDQTFNNDSNPPSFTSICSTAVPHSIAIPTQNLILGTTIGRMLAIDLRFNSHSYRHLGVFKGFGGGAIRDIKYVSQSINSYKILSCSLDRFVRIHNFSTSSSSTRSLDSKFYLKTRPTCLEPISSGFMYDSIFPHADAEDSDDSDSE